MSSIRAFIDESGQRGPGGDRHFIMSAVIVREEKLDQAEDLLSAVKASVRREPHHELHWNKVKRHSYRLVASHSVGNATSLLRAISVVVCKDHLDAGPHLSDDRAYMYTFRYLLERLSWFARENNAVLSYTLGHVVRFKLETLREYESVLRTLPTEIKWSHLDPAGGKIDQPKRISHLQLADVVASATGAAFNPDEFGFTERRYLENLRPILYVPPGKRLTTYGLKMHPWKDSTKAAYPWVATL